MDKCFCSHFRNQGYKRQTATDHRIESHPLTGRNIRLKALLLIQVVGWQHKWQWDGWLNFTESVAMATQMVSCDTDELRAQYDKYTTEVSNQNITYNKRSGIKFRQTPPNGREFGHISTYTTQTVIITGLTFQAHRSYISIHTSLFYPSRNWISTNIRCSQGINSR